jgi:hypothetical protein
MNLQPRSTTTAEHPGARNKSETHLQGVWLVLARIAWVVITLLATGLFVASLPPYFAYLHMLNTASAYGPQLAPSDVQELQRLGLSLDFYAWFYIGMIAIILLVCVFVGVVLFWRASSDRMALLASLSLVLFPIALETQIVGTLPPAWTLPSESVAFVGNVCLGLFFYLFPSGRFIPRWTRWLMVVWIVNWAISDFFPGSAFNNSWFSFVLFVALIASLIVLQMYRYRRLSTPTQRQQTKWVVFGTALGFGGFVFGSILFFALLPKFFPLSPLTYTLAQLLLYLLLLLFPLSIGIAILRYRLWDIDALVNRTLVYGMLTVSLALVYSGLVIALQALLRGLISQTNDIAIVASTLAIAALFQPLRRRIQRVIDRRFYRRKYDAARTLEAFSATLRNEVDLTTLSEQLVAVVQETMQPAHVSLWLRRPNKRENQAGTPEGPSGTNFIS